MTGGLWELDQGHQGIKDFPFPFTIDPEEFLFGVVLTLTDRMGCELCDT